MTKSAKNDLHGKAPKFLPLMGNQISDRK